MGSLSKKVTYICDNFLLSACQFTASSQGNGKFMEFVCLHGADSISQKLPKFYLLTHYFTYSPKFFANSLFCPFPKIFHHQSFPLYGTIYHFKMTTLLIATSCTYLLSLHVYTMGAHLSGPKDPEYLVYQMALVSTQV